MIDFLLYFQILVAKEKAFKISFEIEIIWRNFETNGLFKTNLELEGSGQFLFHKGLIKWYERHAA